MAKCLRIARFVPCLLLLAACGTSRPRATSDPGAGAAPAPALTGACSIEGQVRSCKEKINETDRVEGTQECLAGAWSACRGGEVSLMSLGPGAGSLGPLSSACAANACNPYCSGEDSTDPLAPNQSTSGGDVTYVNSNGPFGGAPAGFAKK